MCSETGQSVLILACESTEVDQCQREDNDVEPALEEIAHWQA